MGYDALLPQGGLETLRKSGTLSEVEMRLFQRGMRLLGV
jgi:hypothetical protein